MRLTPFDFSEVVVPQTLNILAPSGVKSLTDFACAQWSSGSVWKESIKSAYTDLYCPECIPPEYHYWARDSIHEHNATISLDVCNKMFYVSFKKNSTRNNQGVTFLIREITRCSLQPISVHISKLI